MRTPRESGVLVRWITLWLFRKDAVKMRGVTVYERIYRVVRRVPRGRVATYGQVAEMAEASGPRQVGYALHALPEGHDLPWHRIINARGEISLDSGLGGAGLQRALLETEKIVFDAKGHIDLKRFQWKGAPDVPARKRSYSAKKRTKARRR
jgi:methylated-DNA-protein-cysteine methyltransferase-like protein